MASVEEREPFAFTPAETAALLEDQRQAGRSSLLLSTCNRCELYWSGDDDLEPWFRQVAEAGEQSPPPPAATMGSRPCVTSSRLPQVSIRRFWARPRSWARCGGPMMRRALRDHDPGDGPDPVGRARCRTSGPLRDDARPPPGFGELGSSRPDCRALGRRSGPEEVVVLGAGEAAEGVLRALHERGLPGHAAEPASGASQGAGGGLGSRQRAWEELRQRLARAPTFCWWPPAAREPVVSGGRAFPGDGGPMRPGALRDGSGVPRNVDPARAASPAIHLFDLDDLQRLCCPGRRTASAALDDADR